jgi:hypothetical protein
MPSVVRASTTRLPHVDLRNNPDMDSIPREVATAYWADEESAKNRVWLAMREGGPVAIELLEWLAKEAPTEDALANLGAGPMEDVVRRHGFELIDELDAAIEREPSLKLAVQHVRVGVEQLGADVNFRSFYLGKGANDE